MASTDQIRTGLQAVRDLLAPPRAWTQSVYARTAPAGPAVPARSARANCWCLMGAIQRTATPVPQLAMDLVHHLGGANAVTTFNDDPKTKHDTVLAFLDTKIAALPAPNPDLETNQPC